jgi:Spy/CpxP family protein refolding chaperone
MKRNHLAAALLALLLFCSGAVVGALGHRYYTDTVIAKSAEDFRHHYVTEMRTRLHLTPAQVTQLEAILDDTKAKYKAVRDSYHPEMVKIRNEQIGRVKSILTPEQIPAYEQLVAEHEQRAREQEEHQGPHDHGRPHDHQQPTQ